MAIYLIMVLSILNHAGFGGSRVVVSLYALELGASPFALGTIMALYGLCPMLLAVSYGKLADRIGPRLPMLAGTAGVSLALLLPPLFPGLPTLYLSALLLGMSFHLFFVVVTSIAGGIGGEGHRVNNYALLSLGFSSAAFLGPMAAGFSIDHLGHLPTFVLLASFPVIPLLMLWLKPGFLPLAVKRDGAGEKKNFLDLWRMPLLRNTFIASGIIAAAWDLFQFYLPVYGHSIGLSASAIGMVLGSFAAATFVVRIVVPRLISLAPEAAILTYAIFIAAASFILFPFFRSAYALAAVAFVLGLGCGVGQPLSMSLIYALSPKGRMAESSGVRVMINNFAHMVIPVIFGGVGTLFGFFPVFLANSVMLAAGGFLMGRRNAPPPEG